MVSRAERGALADWFWTIDRFFLAMFVFLMGIGFMLSFAASPAVAERIGLEPFHFVKRHAVFALPALGVTRPINAFSVVDRPDPLRPSRLSTSPAATSKLTPCRMWLLP